MLASPLIGLWLRMPRIGARGEETVVLDDPEVRLALTGRSGPVVVEIEYRVEWGDCVGVSQCHAGGAAVPQAQRRLWLVNRARPRDPELWTERYRCPTWFDYLRQRNRATQSETATERQALAFHIGPGPVRVRRMLERPFGSVRSKDYTPDDAAGADHSGVDRADATIGAPAGASAVASPNRT